MKGRVKKRCSRFTDGPELQALVDDILPPTSAIIDYVLGLDKLSANGQFFAGAHMAISL